MSLTDFAVKELRLMGMDPSGDSNDPNTWIANDVLNLIKILSMQGHSGSSISYAIGLFERLARYEPLTPLQGTDDEWVNVTSMSPGPLWQNKRCSRVFKDETRAYDIDGRVFREKCIDENGEEYTHSFTNRDSFVTVTFPYTPTTEYVDVPPRTENATR